MKKPIIIGNWKMYVEKPETAKEFLRRLKRQTQLLAKTDIVLAPPFTLIPALRTYIGTAKTIRLGSQTISASNDAKHTGEVSGPMLKAFGVSAAIIGHSERRAMGENNDIIRAQIRMAHTTGLVAVLCIGEESRDQQGAHFTAIETQLKSALQDKTGGKLIVAYEPVWAIGKSAADAMKPTDLEEMAIFIRKTLATILGREAALKVPILYGGSVEDTNAKNLLKEGGVSGFLVGHASSEVDSFISLIKALQ